MPHAQGPTGELKDLDGADEANAIMWVQTVSGDRVYSLQAGVQRSRRCVFDRGESGTQIRITRGA